MNLLSHANFEKTTLQHVIEKAEGSSKQVFDLVHLSLDSGQELILLAVAGPDLDAVGMILEGVRSLQPGAK